MVNWKKFKIESKKIGSPDSIMNSFIAFELDGPKPTSNYSFDFSRCIYCRKSYIFDDYQVGDYIEIDIDKTKCEESSFVFHDPSVMRKFEVTSMTIGSTTITREHGLAVARQLDAYVEQSGGRNEYTASIEAYDNQGNSIKFSLSSKRANNN